METGKAILWTCGRDTMDQYGVSVSAQMASFARVEARTGPSNYGSSVKAVTGSGSERHQRFGNISQ